MKVLTDGGELGPDEKYCTECGAIIKKKAEMCPECGINDNVRADKRTEKTSTEAAREQNAIHRLPGFSPNNTTRRNVLATAAYSIIGLAGLGAIGSTTSQNDNSERGSNSGGDNGDVGGDGDGNSNNGLQVRVEYSGEWSGVVGNVGSSRTVQGRGTETVDISDDSDIVSANAQKQDRSRETLTIQILDDGEVVAEESTSAGFGVAQVSYDTFNL